MGCGDGDWGLGFSGFCLLNSATFKKTQVSQKAHIQRYLFGEIWCFSVLVAQNDI
jgi:hypothetical protein